VSLAAVMALLRGADQAELDRATQDFAFGGERSEHAALIADRAALVTLLKRLGGTAMMFTVSKLAPVSFRPVLLALSEADLLTVPMWGRLCVALSSTACVELLTDTETFPILRRLPGDPVALFPLLERDPLTLGEALNGLPDYRKWCVDVLGADRIQSLSDQVSNSQAAVRGREARIREGGLADWLKTLPKGPVSDAALCAELYANVLVTTDTNEAKALFRARFGVSLERESEEANAWNPRLIARIWQVCDQQGADVAGLDRIISSDSKRSGGTYADDGTRSGQEIGITDPDEQQGAINLVSADDDRAIAGVNAISHLLRHEIGHHVAAKSGLDEPGGWVTEVGGWQTHEDLGALVKGVFLRKFPTSLSAKELDQFVAALRACEGNLTAGRVIDSLKKGGASTETIDTVFGWELLDYLQSVASSDGGYYGASCAGTSEIDGRMYHVPDEIHTDFVSFPMALLSKKVSLYSLFSPAEWFAEIYATFYSDFDSSGQPGTTLKALNSDLESKFREDVHVRGDFEKRTGKKPVAAPS
jgi:hypothetical protein